MQSMSGARRFRFHTSISDHPSDATSSLFEQGDLPFAGRRIVPQDEQTTVTTPNLKVAVIPTWPVIEYLHDLDATVADEERPWDLFASVARGTLHTNGHLWIHIPPLNKLTTYLRSFRSA
jgi:hypothetical protein